MSDPAFGAVILVPGQAVAAPSDAAVPVHPAVVAARGWIGTPYLHHAAVRGAGCDCLGLLRGLWRECVGPEPETPPAYTRDWSEPQGEERLWAAALRHLLPAHDEKPGDILLFRMREGAVAKHLGLAAATGGAATFIHAYAGHGVVESPLSAPWRRRIVARFVFPTETARLTSPTDGHGA